MTQVNPAFNGIYHFYIAHVMSNLTPLFHIIGFGILLEDANQVGDWQAYMEAFMYMALFGVVAQFLQLINGVPALQYLNEDHPYDDMLLLPSILYGLGILQRKPRIDDNNFSDNIDDSPKESDPSVVEDEVIIFNI